MQIGVAQDWVHDHRDALDDAVDGSGALQRVALVLQQQVGLELNEVGLVFLDVFPEVAGGVFSGEGVGVVAIGQEQNLEVHALAEEHVGASECGMDAGSVAVVEQDDVGGEAMQDVDLVDGERRSGVGHDILDASLMHGDDVGVALDHVDAVFLGDGALGLIESVELAVLVIDVGVGRVDVFLLDALRGRIELSPAESHDLSRDTNPREDDASGIAVDEFASVVLVADADLGDEFLLVALLQGAAPEGKAVVEVEAELELPDDVVADATLAEVLHAHGNAVGMVVEKVFEVLQGVFVHDEHGFSLALLTFLLVGEFAFLYFDVVFFSEPAQCLGIGHLLVLHDERDGCAALAAAEAMAGVAGW